MTTEARVRLLVVGCGDVFARHYLPALEASADRAEIRAVVDPRPGAAAEAVRSVARWSPEATAETDLATALARVDLDAAVNLTPAPLHGPINAAILAAGRHLYSEKPLAGSVAEATRLIETAARRGLHFLCAPGSAATTRFRWLAETIASGRHGSPTLVVAHHADPGPAAWREYTGDPTPFYREGVGPVFDHGVYRLHEMTTLLGPVARVQAMGSISSPTRVVRGGPLTGRTIQVTTPDHVLINLEFRNGALGQLLASFGTAATKAPWLEIHFPMATLSFAGQSWEPDAPASLYVDDEGPGASERWIDGIDVPMDPAGVVETGVTHFIACLRGETRPILTAEHARHVLDVILQAYASIGDGRTHETETTF
ncbi:MAG TPA: Gfo/Idh/MocA family oxidoreductase [Candidatus Limnocylindrales bacterium]